MSPLFKLLYTTHFKNQLQAIERKYHSLIRQTIEAQLRFEPAVRTRNRKPLTKPGLFAAGTWEIRLGPDNSIRVFYEVDRKHLEVSILAVGLKKGNRLYLGGEEIEL